MRRHTKLITTTAVAAALAAGVGAAPAMASTQPSAPAAPERVATQQSLSWGGLLSSSTVREARPEVWGMATPGATVSVRDSLGNVYGTAVVNDDYEFTLQFDRSLKAGYTQLILVQELGGASRFDAIGTTYTPAG